MSVSDPLLKTLKLYVYELRIDKNPIKDNHKSLVDFCEVLESIFRKGLKQSNSVFGVSRRDYWNWVEQIGVGISVRAGQPGLSPQLSMTLDATYKCKKVTTTRGRGRLFMRLALQKRALLSAVDVLQQNTGKLVSWYDPSTSIIGNEILGEIFKSLLFEVNSIKFELNTKNSGFLDETWELPLHKETELVPCHDIGVQVHHYHGRVFVTSVDPGSVAEDNGIMEPGDVIDEVLKHPVRNILKGAIPKLLRDNSGFPVQVAVSKYNLADGSKFRPIVELMKQGNIQLDAFDSASDGPKRKPPHAHLPDDDYDDVPVHNADDAALYPLHYLGKTLIGPDGSVKQVENAVGRVVAEVKPEENKDKLQNVFLELGETNVFVRDSDSKEVLFNHSYTEISACGRRTDLVEYFAYIAGETTCTIANQFVGYVFKSKNDDETKTILCSIAQGFNRTHWLM